MSTQSTADDAEPVTYVSHKYLEPDTVESRTYQVELAKSAGAESSLVALPTGTGKTVVSLLITAHRLAEKRGRAVFLAPTKPLVEQQAEFYTDVLNIPEEECAVFTGEVRPAKREELWAKPLSVVFATPQVIENDLIDQRISFANVTHLTFDECHRATGDYSYVYIAEKYLRQAEQPLVTGLSASPGSDERSILEVCKNLGVTNIEVITEDDPLLEPYVHKTEVSESYVDLDEEILAVRDLLRERKKECLTFLKKNGYLNSARQNLPSYELRKAPARIKKDMGKSSDDSTPYVAMSQYAEAMKLDTAIGIVETQGLEAFSGYMRRQREEANSSGGSKATQRMLQEEAVVEALRITDEYDKTHPKLQVLRHHLIDAVSSGGQLLIFTQNRDNVSVLVDFINEHNNISAHKFIGQSGSDGMSQKEQGEIIRGFRNGEYDALVSTSIGEEGLDIPQVDVVLFYEPTPSGIRSIQRRGRTGRAHDGKVVVLIGNRTRDYAYHRKAKNDEDSMEEDMIALRDMQDSLEERLLSEFGEPEESSSGQAVLQAFESETESQSEDDLVTVIVDSRETSSRVVKELDRTEGTAINIENNLPVGDYVVSERTAIERKSVADFHATLTGGDRSMFEQVGEIANNYENPILIIEGSKEALYQANIHPNAIRGALSSLIIDFGASVIYTLDEEDTAHEIIALAKREQVTNQKEVSAHGKKTNATPTEQQEYIVASFADIGPRLAKRLLTEFETIAAIVGASESELMEVEGVGKKTAENIATIVAREYTK